MNLRGKNKCSRKKNECTSQVGITERKNEICSSSILKLAIKRIHSSRPPKMVYSPPNGFFRKNKSNLRRHQNSRQRRKLAAHSSRRRVEFENDIRPHSFRKNSKNTGERGREKKKKSDSLPQSYPRSRKSTAPTQRPELLPNPNQLRLTSINFRAGRPRNGGTGLTHTARSLCFPAFQ